MGFRKSLFGFNTDDVLTYIRTSHDTFSEKENQYKADIASCHARLDELEQQLQALGQEKANLTDRLAEYEARNEEMERLSENIGKLYLVAQTNASSILANAEENSEMVNRVVQNNLCSIDSAREQLETVKEKINAVAEDFNRKLSELVDGLDQAKTRISQNRDADLADIESFNELYKMLEK